MTDTNSQEEVVTPEENEGEGTEDIITLKKEDYSKLNETIGSLKREIKDLRKANDRPKETTETPKNQAEENVLLQRLEGLVLQQSGITHQDDIELAKNTAKKWGLELEKVVNDEDFKMKLDRQRTTRNNVAATTNIRGGGGSKTTNTPEYWIAKGVPPTATDVPNRQDRVKIAKAMMKNASTGGKTFYND